MSTSPRDDVRYRSLRFGVTRGVLRQDARGVQYLRAEQPLEPYAKRMTARLGHWAETDPDRIFMARRVRNADGSTGDWLKITYREALDTARRVGQALLDRGLNAEPPVAILCENSLEHAMLALGCLYAGIPYSPVSSAYSTISQ